MVKETLLGMKYENVRRKKYEALDILIHCSVTEESRVPGGFFIMILSKYRFKMHISCNGPDLDDKLQLKGCNGIIKPFISHQVKFSAVHVIVECLACTRYSEEGEKRDFCG